MSFYCAFCCKVAPNGVKSRMVTTQIKLKWPGHRGGDHGADIAEEKKMCDACYTSGVHVFADTVHGEVRTAIQSRIHLDDYTGHVLEGSGFKP